MAPPSTDLDTQALLPQRLPGWQGRLFPFLQARSQQGGGRQVGSEPPSLAALSNVSFGHKGHSETTASLFPCGT